MPPKSERLRKLESELEDLKKWLDLGLVPKNDLLRHKAEIEEVEKRIVEELSRLEAIRQNGNLEEFSAPKKPNRAAYNETPTNSGFDLDTTFEEEGFNFDTESSMDHTTATGYETEMKTLATDEQTLTHTWEEDPFQERNRWRGREIVDPDADEW